METEVAIHSAYDDHSPFDASTPEKNLMQAILRIAMDDVRKKGELHRDARRFFMAAEDGYLFSFVSICAHLGICPNRVRRALGLLNELRADQLAA